MKRALPHHPCWSSCKDSRRTPGQLPLHIQSGSQNEQDHICMRYWKTRNNYRASEKLTSASSAITLVHFFGLQQKIILCSGVTAVVVAAASMMQMRMKLQCTVNSCVQLDLKRLEYGGIRKKASEEIKRKLQPIWKSFNK